jgi:hypothetical protein
LYELIGRGESATLGISLVGLDGGDGFSTRSKVIEINCRLGVARHPFRDPFCSTPSDVGKNATMPIITMDATPSEAQLCS